MYTASLLKAMYYASLPESYGLLEWTTKWHLEKDWIFCLKASWPPTANPLTGPTQRDPQLKGPATYVIFHTPLTGLMPQGQDCVAVYRLLMLTCCLTHMCAVVVACNEGWLFIDGMSVSWHRCLFVYGFVEDFGDSNISAVELPKSSTVPLILEFMPLLM